MIKTRFHLVAWLLVGLIASSASAQLESYKGDPLHRYEGIHSGNKVRTIFYNYGLVGNLSEISGEWPLGTGNEYIGDVTILVGIEYFHPSGDTIHSVVTCRSPRGTDDISQSGVHWGFEPLPGFGSPPLQGSEEPGKVAMSHLKQTWPEFWPDKMYSDVRDQLWEMDDFDPGWSGNWNGFFGKGVTNADQESYWQMDDNMDSEFRVRQDTADVSYTYYPTSMDTARGGMGIRVAGRGFQWSHFLAEDAIIWHYEITNISDFEYDKVAFGMVVGTLSGGRNDAGDDLAFFDPANDITYSYDSDDRSLTPGWVPVSDRINVGYAGYAFLESPGNSFDGIDNDGDSPNNSPALTPDQLREWSVDGITYQPEDKVILIDYVTYERSEAIIPESGILEYSFRGEIRELHAGQVLIEDGNNGIDDNFNGLIDERYGVEINGKRLDHVGLKYKDYRNGFGLDDPMIDEARDDGIDNDGDWDILTDDVGFDGAPSTGDRGEGDGVPTSGEPHFDKTDIDESDQIGLTSFDYFNNRSAERLFLRGDDDVWRRMEPGIIDVVPNSPMDGDFIYGSGYFPLPPGKTERLSIALFMGEDLVDITQNKVTVQQIYDNNYNFARPPEKPTVTAVAGDGYVTLYWDDVAESSIDMSQPEDSRNDFEGYKVYRATDPGFLENYIITDGLGRKVFHKPEVQFDLVDGKLGFFSGGNLGVSYYLGDDSGLEHVWTDSLVENGQTYYYAVTAYDFGNEALNFFPAETPKFIFVDEAGRVTTDVNTVVVVPGVHVAGYIPPVIGMANSVGSYSDGVVYVESVDPTRVEENVSYRVTFDNEDESGEATTYSLHKIHSDNDTRLLFSDDLMFRDENRRITKLFNESFDTLYGNGRGTYDTRSYFEVIETSEFDGLRMFLLTPRYPGRFISGASGWIPSSNVDPDSLIGFDMDLINYPTARFYGEPFYANYRIEFFNTVQDTAIEYHAGFGLVFEERELYFKVTNLRTNRSPILLVAQDSINDGHIHDRSEILILEEIMTDSGLDTIATWSIAFRENEDHGWIYEPAPGDVINFKMYQPFGSESVFEFTPEAAKVTGDLVDLSRIKVYPNPYMGANSQEPVNPYSSGRGERRITFIHLPKDFTIRIYTVRGELVQTINHTQDQTIFDGSANWDLRSSGGLDVAYGVYIYHVDSPHGEHVGKFAVIK